MGQWFVIGFLNLGFDAMVWLGFMTGGGITTSEAREGKWGWICNGVVVDFDVVVGLLWIFEIQDLLDGLDFVAMDLAKFCGQWWFLVMWWQWVLIQDGFAVGVVVGLLWDFWIWVFV